jgi:hypothetical protein
MLVLAAALTANTIDLELVNEFDDSVALYFLEHVLEVASSETLLRKPINIYGEVSAFKGFADARFALRFRR